MHGVVDSRHEEPVFIPQGRAELFGLITRPPEGRPTQAVILAWGGGHYPTPGRNQTRTRLARELARRGAWVLRYDYPGVGESSGSYQPIDFSRPLSIEIETAHAWARDQGFDQVSIVANCFGGRNVLAAAPRLEGLDRVALISVPIADEGHYSARVRSSTLGAQARMAMKVRRQRNQLDVDWKRMARAARRLFRAYASQFRDRVAGAQESADLSTFEQSFRELVDSGTEVLFVSGTQDDFHDDMLAVSARVTGRKRAQRAVTLRVVEGRINGYASLAVQQAVIDHVVEWLAPWSPK